MVVVMRNTVLRGTKRVINIAGLPTYEIEVTDNSVIHDGVEILTESLIHVKDIVELYNLKSLHARGLLGQYTKTDLGYLARDGEFLYLTNSKLEPVCCVPISIFTALKLMSLKKTNEVNLQLPAPFLKSSKHAFVMSQLFTREEINNFMLRRDRFFKYGDKFYVVNMELGYSNILNHIVSLSGTEIELTSEFIKTLIEFNSYTQLDERKFLKYNGILLEISEYNIIERIPMQIPKPF